MIDHLSPSSIEQFLKCSWQWKLQRIDKIPRGVSWQQLAGGIVHAVAEWNFLNKIDSGKDLTESQLIEYSHKISRVKIDEVPLWHNTPGKKLDDDLDCLKTRVEVCTRLFAQKVAPEIDPLAVEKKLEIPEGRGFPKIICILDCIDKTAKIHDFKTAGKMPNVDEHYHNDQVTAYGLAYRLAFGHDPKGFIFHYMVEKANPVATEISQLRTAKSYVSFLMKAQRVWAAYLANVFTPSTRAWWCSDEWCYYAMHDQCEFFVKYA